MKNLNQSFFLFLSILLLSDCSTDNMVADKIDQLGDAPLFLAVPASQSNIDFENTITETEEANVFVYEYFYNGGGVAVGDINKDGLEDLYFTGNQVPNKMYLNLGNLEFKDITEEANLIDDGTWSTGATFADVNNDGYLDLYVCSAELRGNRNNKLYINDQNGKFIEQSKAFGLEDQGFSTHATFLDFDKDGDLDLYLVNHSPLRTMPLEVQQKARKAKPKEISDQFYRNEGGQGFVNISEEVGITPYYSFGLSATSCDINGDGWTDVYVTNDYDEPDQLFINDQGKRFVKTIKSSTKHISMFGMGADVADFNNDLLPDIMVADMTAEDNRRQKLNMASMNPKLFWTHINLGYHYQYMHNTLQYNYGNDENGAPIFGEIAQIMGVPYTDWSWSVLMEDFDNDAWKDLLVTNGYLNLRDNDFRIRNKAKQEELGRPLTNLEKVALLSSEKTRNYAFQNVQGQKFENKSKAWGLDLNSFSNGAAYADLDNDGDLDYIINNINDKVSIFENRASDLGANYYLQVTLEANESNAHGLGAKIYLTANGMTQYKEVMNTRGYLGSVPSSVHFGLGTQKK
ncbi:MAG: CRTAC1 family protein, partial [Bacteroidota bacterium]